MAFDINNVFQPLSAPDFPAVPGTVITAAYYNNEILDICAGITAARGMSDTLGSLTIGKSITSADVSLRVAGNRTGSGNSYVDLVSDTTYPTYGLRLSKALGANGVASILARGTGGLALQASEGPATYNVATGFTHTFKVNGGDVAGFGDAVQSFKGPVIISQGPLNTPQGANIASAATINLDSATGNVVVITGTTPISAATLTDGRQRLARFSSACQLTHGASLVVLPGLATTTVGAGDFVHFEAIGGVKYARVFRGNGSEFKYASGAISGADTSVTLPTGTWKRARLAIGSLKANSDYWLGGRVNGSSAANYLNSIASWNGSAGGNSGGAVINAAIFNVADAAAGVGIDQSNITSNPLNGDFEVLNPDQADHIDIRSRTQYRDGSGNLTAASGSCRFNVNGPVTQMSLHLRAGYTGGVGLSGANVTPTSGTYELWLTP